MPRRSLADSLPRPSGVPEMLTVAQVCKALHISRTTLYSRRYRYTQEAKGSKRLYFADDIRLHLTLNTVTPD